MLMLFTKLAYAMGGCLTMITTWSPTLSFGGKPARCSVTTSVNVYDVPLGGVNAGAINVGFATVGSESVIPAGAGFLSAFVEATVPRITVVLRKAYGGAYIVMDSRQMGSDLYLAWPTAEVAVMGSKGAVEILHRRVSDVDRAELELAYEDRLLLHMGLKASRL